MGLLRSLAVGMGCDRLPRAVMGGAGVILMFHGVRPSPGGWRGDVGLTVTPEMLREYLRAMIAEGYQPLPLSEALTWLDHPPRGGRRFVAVTFDDGYRDNHDVALPILRELGVPATVYVTTGFVDRTHLPWWLILDAAIGGCDEVAMTWGDGEVRMSTADKAAKDAAYARLSGLLIAAPAVEAQRAAADLAHRCGIDEVAILDRHFLDWDGVRGLAASGLVEIGAHCVSHIRLAGLPLAAVIAEMDGSRRRLEAMTERPVAHFAYPYGDPAAIDAATVEAARSVGFASAVIGYGRVVRRRMDRFTLPRIALGTAETLTDLRVRMTGAGDWLGS